MERIPACRMWSGVTKSGSPTPRQITSGIVLIISKNFRMPDGLTFCTRCDNTSRLSVSINPFPLPAHLSTTPLLLATIQYDSLVDIVRNVDTDSRDSPDSNVTY